MGGLLVAVVCAVVISIVVGITVIFPRDRSATPTKDSHSH
jgi:hypothetical protein